MKYRRLSSPIKIGGLILKNRAAMTAAGCILCDNGYIGDRICEYYKARALGGVGLIISEMSRVSEDLSGRVSANQICVTDDKYIPGLTRLADTVHSCGSKMFIQLQHPGLTAMSIINDGNPPCGPSEIAIKKGSTTPHALTANEIHKIANDFGTAAARIKHSGFDGVEIHGAHFYLLHQFLSPTLNHRTDEYGGSLENRFRFLGEVVHEIRRTCGTDFPLAVRVSVEEFIGKNGYHLDEGIKICRMLEALGVDIIDVSCSGTMSKRAQSVEPISFKQGWRRYFVEAVKKCVKTPVLAVCLIREPAFAEKLLEDGVCDIVGSARCFIADPEWMNKALSGRENEIHHCISCVRCIEDLQLGDHLHCSVNPITGFESEALIPKANGNGKSVVVIGAGPCGMKAAATAAQNGFSVTLFEKNSVPGGQIYLAGKVPFKDKMNWTISDSLNDCKRFGVKMVFSCAPTLSQIADMKPYAIINATGGVPLIPPFALDAPADFVCSAEDILSDRVQANGKNVVIIGSGMTGLETAEYLIQRDCTVTVVEMSNHIAPGAFGGNRNDVVSRLEPADVIFMLNRKVTAIKDGSLILENTADRESYELPADLVVLSVGTRPCDDYPAHLESICEKHIVAGSAQTPARLYEAVRSGYLAALSL